MPTDEETIIHVLPGLQFQGKTLRTRREPEALDEYLHGFPPPARRAGVGEPGTRGARLTPDTIARLREEFPWLTDEDLGLEHGHHHGSSSGGGGHGGGAGVHDGPRVLPKDLDEEHARQVRERLMARRELWARDFSDMYFYVRILGGVWTEHFGHDDANNHSAFARACVIPWTRLYKWPKQRGFHIATYGEEGANMLAREWCNKGHFYYTMWRDRGSDKDYRYTDEDIAAYVPPAEFLDWACELAVDTRAFDMVLEVTHAKPENPGP